MLTQAVAGPPTATMLAVQSSGHEGGQEMESSLPFNPQPWPHSHSPSKAKP